MQASEMREVARRSVQLCSGALLVGLAAGCAGPKPEARPAGKGVQIVMLPDRLGVNINGKVFTEYVFHNTPRPYCYPVLGPGGVAMTRNFPMREARDEERDHKHHRSFWFAHGSVNGLDFWSESERAGKILHEAFTAVRSGRDVGLIRARNRWVAADGRVVCTDERTLRFYNRPERERIVDFEITLQASHGALTLGDTKEGTMALRLAETLRLKPNRFHAGQPTGHIVNSEGLRDGATWGKRAAWCDYYGPAGGKTVGVAIFDHPQNPRHPTWWHVRDYGLFAANPFGQHDFENLSDKTAGNLVVPAGQSVTFRYRFYFHEGDEQQARVAERYADYVRTTALAAR